MKKYLLIGLISSLVFTSCKHDSLYEPIDEPPIVDTECDPNTVYFINDVLPIIQSSCAFSGCHGSGSAQDGVDLSTYAGIMQEVQAFDANDSKLYEVIIENDNDDVMPPNPYNRLTTAQILLIKNWINQGAQNNECSDCNTTAVTFAQTISPIIQNNCQGCHSGTAPQGNLSLTNYTQIKTIADNGKLLGTINHSNGFVPMPYNQPQLSDCKIDQVTNWVNAGSPNN